MIMVSDMLCNHKVTDLTSSHSSCRDTDRFLTHVILTPISIIWQGSNSLRSVHHGLNFMLNRIPTYGSVIHDVTAHRSHTLQWYTQITHTRLTALCPVLPRWADIRKVKSIWILLKEKRARGSGISWALCKSAPRSRQITTQAAHVPPCRFFTGQMPFLPPS